jgi:hypothetical protein
LSNVASALRALAPIVRVLPQTFPIPRATKSFDSVNQQNVSSDLLEVVEIHELKPVGPLSGLLHAVNQRDVCRQFAARVDVLVLYMDVERFKQARQLMSP